MITDQLWPRYAGPADLPDVERVPLHQRGLPNSTFEIVERAAGLWPDAPAVTVLPDATRWDNGASKTFGELAIDVRRYANFLRAIGVQRDSVVALLCPNCDELITATLAAQLAGIAAPINSGLSAEQVGELLARSGARTLIGVAPEFDAASWDVAKALAEGGSVDCILLLSPTGTTVTAPVPTLPGVTVGYLTDMAAGSDGAVFAGDPPEPGDLAAIFHTGGTTGTPKLAAHTHANEVTDAWMVAAADTVLDQDSVVFAALPLFHVNALVVTLLAPLLRGQRVVWAGPLGYRDPALYANFWKIVQQYQVAAMSAVPTVYAVLAQCPIDADISSMRIAIVGASALPPAVRKDFESHTGITLVEGYGLTEATCASARSFGPYPRPGSVGQRLPYQQITAAKIDEQGHLIDLPAGEVGTLIISGPTVFAGYVSGHGAHGLQLDGLGSLHGERLDTGDLGWVDDDGFVYLTGRAKDLIIRGGHNIDPTQIEDALLTHGDVASAAAVGAPDAHSGEVPVAYVTLHPGSVVSAQELTRWAATQVGERAAAPRKVTILDGLPVTAIGKPYKVPLRADAARDVFTDALAGHDGVCVHAEIEGGAPVLIVEIADPAHREDIDRVLARYAVTYRVVEAN
ncbi:acyl-CoA synthetase [Mycolicibacterium frederiksbergense]|uniref:acyl-CoA synthetase n=1 Tax=Mycolicibacterium frederiksbergense TaxID=117567 RepID=UPI00265BDA36|nr:acyl-CoA synthetase [Mycolicibacterium frederiksbergense]MDO0977976.1 acyl-CoA synthetase [Mycolicibacterium frederiksbergense]